MRKTLIAVAGAMLAASANAGEMSDDEIIASIIREYAFPSCDILEHPKWFANMARRCSGEEGKFARLAIRAADRCARIKSGAIGIVSHQGTPSELPYLYGFADDPKLCASATGAILQIEGFTTNSMKMVEKAMAIAENGEKRHLCLYFKTLLFPEHISGWRARTELAKSNNAKPEARELMLSALRRYAMDVPAIAVHADELLSAADPEYAKSAYRREALRKMGKDKYLEYNVKYAAKALSKMDAAEDK